MLLDKTIDELHEGLKNGKFTSQDIVKECYQNIKKLDGKINSFITLVDEKKALEHAGNQDNLGYQDNRGKLAGLPFVLKDAYVTQEIKTTSASKVLDNFIPPYSATVYKKLIEAGAILLGKMNMDAWGHGGSSENTDFGPVHSPWNLERVAGGSSGGPAAAIASRFCVFAIGEDTGGSIRNPAAWCNITGLKVTYGRVSRYGTIAYASSFDSVGPMAKTSEDCAAVLEVIAGSDPYDATSSSRPVPLYAKNIKGNLKGMVIGMPKEFYEKGLDVEILKAIKNAAEKLKELGAEIKEISMPLLEYSIPVYYIIGPSETGSNLGRYTGLRYGNDRQYFSDETKRRIMIGTYALSAGYYDAYYKKAQQVRTLLIEEYNKAFSKCDAVLMPVSPTPPTKIGLLINDPVQNLLADIFTTSQNPVGVPSLAIPCGFTKDNLPIGMQFVGKMFSEDLLLKIGHQYQLNTDWHKRKPSI